MNQLPYYQFPQFPQQLQVQQPQKPQPGFVVMPTEQDAMKYPIAPGNSITFKIENQPIMIEKTMGFSQFDSPVVKRYRIVEEDAPAPEPSPEFALKDDIDRIESEIEKIRALLPKRTVKKKEEDDE